MTPWQLRQTVHLIQHGGIIAYPTETIYGLGCDPLNAQAVLRLLQIKHRPMYKGLILIAADLQQLSPFIADLSSDQQSLLKNMTEQPITWLVPKAEATPVWLSGEHDTIAVRVTTHPVTRRLCSVFGYPLVSTSANPGGQPVARNALAVRRYFGDHLDRIVCGDVPRLNRPSKIKDLASGRVLR